MSVRSYGEFASRSKDATGKETGPAVATVPGLEGQVAPDYPPWDLAIPDRQRLDAWLTEFRRFEQDGNLPALSILHLPNDHTSGTARRHSHSRARWWPRTTRPSADFVEAVSKSRFWKESAIFVVEDDAQDGPDHVDAHRSVLLVASPYVRKGAVDSTLYTTCGVLRTMELILGLPPLSQCDAAATPLYAAFQSTPMARTFAALAPRVSARREEPRVGARGRGLGDPRLLRRGPDPHAPHERDPVGLGPRPERPHAAPVRAAFVRPVGGRRGGDEDE